MKRSRELAQRLHALSVLSEAFDAVRSVAASRFRGARAALEPYRLYRQALHEAVACAGVMLPGIDAEAPRVLVCLGSDHGLCGSFNARVAERAAEELAARPGPSIVVGRRLGRILARRGAPTDAVLEAPANEADVARVMLRLSDEVMRAQGPEGLGGVEVVCARFGGIGSLDVRAEALLPLHLDVTRPSYPPTPWASEAELTEVAVRELLFVELQSFLLESLASEHSARLLATQSASAWLDEHREQARRRLASAEREATTQETLELATVAGRSGAGIRRRAGPRAPGRAAR
ncbi:MAG: F0F1 ATP synthase subunit gamma [Sandaracinaceae bacterium]|nr:F0F1 ATP synthase subunit gamma [Sandaracinaceae bacterium]